MDEHTLQVLEFDKIRALVVQKTLTPVGKENAAELVPLTDREAILTALSRVSELKALLQGGEDFPLQRIGDIRPSLAMCRQQGAVLEPAELLSFSEILEVCDRLASFLEGHRGKFPRLEAVIREIQPLGALRGKIDAKIDSTGQLRDDASNKLRSLRKESETTRDRILSKLRSFLSSLSTGKEAHEGVITLREGRYVVPLRGGQRNKVPGVVHDRSASGLTLFVEPVAVIEMGNRLRELELEERREILRILRILTRSVAEKADEIEVNLSVLGALDLIHAKALFSMDLDAVQPELNAEGLLKLRGARHPLLLLWGGGDGDRGRDRNVIPLDVELGETFCTLLVTGPNTGGKTVVLKTLGLLNLMAQAGLHIPADDNSELPIFQKIFADIGDEQSIEQSLSTFSSHLRQIVKVLEQADENTLVLLDEIGVGTDPEEGTALAMAVLEALTARSACTVVTTHFGALKLFAHDHPGIENASLEFDRQTLRPTYRFLVGVPGSSYALEIAKRLGMQPSVVEKATGLLGEERQETAELIEDLNRRVAFYQRKNAELEEAEKKLNRLTEDYQRKLARVRDEEKQIREEAYRDAQIVLTEANALVERIIAQIRKDQASKTVIKEAHRALDLQSARVKKRLKTLAPPPTHHSSPLNAGDGVWVESLQSEGEVVARVGRRERYKVRVGNLTIEVEASDLKPSATSAKQKSEPGAGIDAGQVFTDQAANEVDLRGLLPDEAVAKLERFLDRAVLAGLRTLWIIHGKGTGALRKSVGEYLKTFPGVKGFRLGAWNEGGDGVTVVELE